jgi:NAD(P)H-hydrate epimerase
LTVVALDLPSGVDADSGAVPGEAVQADWTVTLGAVKQGLLLFPAATRVGRLIGRELGLDDGTIRYVMLDEAEIGRLVPERPPDAHKYRFGRVLVIAGSDHFLGAAVLCSGAAARVGAGLVTVAASRDVRLTVAAHTPEVTYTQDDVRATDGAPAAVEIDGYLASHNSAVIGPGLGRSEATTAFVRTVLERRPREHHLVIDADGLVALSEVPEWPRLVDPHVVLTPHSGELERRVGGKSDNAEPPWVQAGELASRWGCVLVAKGPFTCVANPDGRVAVWPRSNPALATGGTGDVLAGTIAGLVAQGLEAWDAARLAVGVHGLAGERVVVQRHLRTLLASDLLTELPRVMAELIRRR